MIVRITAGVAHDDDMIARLQGLSSNALAAELAGAAPFNGVPDGLTLLIFAFHVDERVRIAEQELNQIAFHGLLFIFEIRCRERMMPIKLNARRQRRRCYE